MQIIEGVKKFKTCSFCCMQPRLVDAHVHLTDPEFSPLSGQITAMLRTLGMSAVSVSMDLETSRKNLELAKASKDVVIPFTGMHPWSAGEDLESFLAFIESHTEEIDGIGEIGLDRKYVTGSEDGYARQKQVFASMLSVAEKLSKPISVHSRGSVDDVIDVLKSYNVKRVLLHWFAGSKQQLKIAADAGYYVSYGPAMVYSQDKKVLLDNTPRELVLVETDGPVRYGACFENRVALPTFLPSVVFALAKTLRMDYADACNTLAQNSVRYLGRAL